MGHNGPHGDHAVRETQRPTLLEMIPMRPASEFAEAMRWAIKAGMTGISVGDRAVYFSIADLLRGPVVDGPPTFTAWYRYDWETSVISCGRIATRDDGKHRHIACDARVDTATESIRELLASLEAKVADHLTTWKREGLPT